MGSDVAYRLEVPLATKEVYAIVSDFTGDKAPSPDGFYVFFAFQLGFYEGGSHRFLYGVP